MITITIQIDDHKGVTMTTPITIQDLQAKLAAVVADAAKETDLKQAIITFNNGNAAIVAGLQKQLAAAIAAAGGAVDPATAAAFQAVSDGLDQVNTTMTTNAKDIADNLVANTPAQSQSS